MNWKNSICLNLTLAKGLSTLPSFITLKSSRAFCCASSAILKGARNSCIPFSFRKMKENRLFHLKSHSFLLLLAPSVRKNTKQSCQKSKILKTQRVLNKKLCFFYQNPTFGRILKRSAQELKEKEVCLRGNIIMLASKKDVILYKMEKEVIDAGKPMFFNQCFDKGRLKNFVLWFLLNYGESKTVQLVEQLKNVGFQYASKAGISLGIDDLKIPPKKNDLIYEAEKLTQVAVNKYASGEITGVERFQSLIDIWHRTSELLKQEVINYFEATDILNPVYMMAFSGARGNISQVRQLVGMRGLMADPQGQIIDFPIRSNFREGLTLTEYIISSYGARKGIVDTALRTANAGYLTRRLVDVAQHVIISNFDCGTRRGIFLTNMKEGNKTIHSVSQRIVGRILARDLFKDSDSPNPIQIASRNDEVTLDLAFEIGKYFSKVFVRSALTCETSKQICQLCYGWSLAQGNLVSIGEAVGVVAAQSIGEPGTQLTMRTFHTGGVFSGDISDQIKAPFDGIVEYEAAIPGTLIRTSEGRISFLTKVEGYFYVHKPINNFDSNLFSIFTKNSDKKLKESLFSESKKFKIPSLTLLYIKNGQRVYAKEVIAQISTISRKANAVAGLAEEAELTIKSECEGQFYSKSLVLNEKEIGPSLPSTLAEGEEEKTTISQKPSSILQKPSVCAPSRSARSTKKNDVFSQNPTDFEEEEQEDSESIAIDKIYQSWTWGYAWILSGKIYEYKLPSLFFPKLGDFMNSKSYISQIEWKLNPSDGHNVFYDIHKRTPGNILNKKYYMSSLPSALLAPVQEAHQEKVGDSFFTAKNAKKGIGLKSNESFNKTLMCKAQSNSTKKAQFENVSPMQSSQILFFDLTKILYKKYGYAFQLPEKTQFFKKSKIASLNNTSFTALPKRQGLHSALPTGQAQALEVGSKANKITAIVKGKSNKQTQKDLLFFIKSLTMLNTSNMRNELPYFLQWFPSKNQTLTGGYVLLETNPTMNSMISQKSHFLHKFNTSFFSLLKNTLKAQNFNKNFYTKDLNTNETISFKLLLTLIEKNKNKRKMLFPSSLFTSFTFGGTTTQTLNRFKKRSSTVQKAKGFESVQAVKNQRFLKEMKKTEALESRVLWVSSSFFKIKLSSLTNCKTSLLFNTSKDSPLRYLTQPFEKSPFLNEQNRLLTPTLRTAASLTSEHEISTQKDEEVQETKNTNLELSQKQSSIKKLNFLFFNRKIPMFLQTNRQGNIKGFQNSNFDSLPWGTANKHIQNPLETEGALLKLKVSNFLTSYSTLPTPSSSHICTSSHFVQFPSGFEPSQTVKNLRFLKENNKTSCTKGTKRINDKKRKLSCFKQFEFANLTTYCRFVNTSLSSLPSFTSLKLKDVFPKSETFKLEAKPQKHIKLPSVCASGPTKAKTRVYFGTFSTFTTLIDNSFNDPAIRLLRSSAGNSSKQLLCSTPFSQTAFKNRSVYQKTKFLRGAHQNPTNFEEEQKLGRKTMKQEKEFKNKERSLFLNSFGYPKESNLFVSNYFEKEYKRFNKIQNKDNFYSFMNQRLFQLTPCLQIHYIKDNTNRYIKPSFFEADHRTIEARSIYKKTELRRVKFVKKKAKNSHSLGFSPSAYGALKKGWVVIPASSKMELWKCHKKRINPGQVLMDKMIFNTPILTECFIFNDIFNIEQISLPKSLSFGNTPLVTNTKVQHLALAPSEQSIEDINELYWVKNNKSRYFMSSPSSHTSPALDSAAAYLQKSSIFEEKNKTQFYEEELAQAQEDGGVSESIKEQIESKSLIKNNVKIGLFIQPVEEYKKMSNFEFKNYVYESNSNTLKNLCKNIESFEKSNIALTKTEGFWNGLFASRQLKAIKKKSISLLSVLQKTTLLREAHQNSKNFEEKSKIFEKLRAVTASSSRTGSEGRTYTAKKASIQSRVNQSFDSLLNFQKYKYNLYNKQNRTLQPLAKFTQKDFSVFSVALWTERTKVLFEKYLSSFKNLNKASALAGTSTKKAKKSQAKKIKKMTNTTKKTGLRSGPKSNLPKEGFNSKKLSLQKARLYLQNSKNFDKTAFIKNNFVIFEEDNPLYVVSRKPLNLSPFLISFENFSYENQRLSNLSEEIKNQKDSLLKPVRYQKVSFKQKTAIELAPLSKALQKPTGFALKGVQSSQKNWNLKEPSTKKNQNNPNKGYFNLSLSYQTYMVSYPPISKFDSLLDPTLNQNLNLILSFYLNNLNKKQSSFKINNETGELSATTKELKTLTLASPSVKGTTVANSFYFNINNLIQNVFESPCFSYNLTYPIDKFTLYKKAKMSSPDGKMQNTQFFYSFPNNSLSGNREEIQSNKQFAQTNYASPFIGEVVYTNKNLLNLPSITKNFKKENLSSFFKTKGSKKTLGCLLQNSSNFGALCSKNVRFLKAVVPPSVEESAKAKLFDKSSILLRDTKIEDFCEHKKQKPLVIQKSLTAGSFEENTLDYLSSEKVPVPPLSYSCMFLTQKDLISFYLPSNNFKQSLNLNYGKKYEINDILVKFLNMAENTDSETIFKQLESFVRISSKDKTVVNTFTKMLSNRKANFSIKIDKLEAGLPLFSASSFSKTKSIDSFTNGEGKEIKNLDNKKLNMSLLGDFIMYGDPINNKKSATDKVEDLREASEESLAAICANGQVIHYNNKKITLRRGQPIFISPKSILHKNDGEFIDPKTPVITLSYQKLKTGDIIQGIPKVEQFLEARTTKRGRLFRDSLPSLLKALFNRYQSKLPLELAVRQSFYKIQQIIVDGVQRVYKSQGVTIADKHLEVIVKQMTSKVRIIDGAQTGFFPGEIVDLNFVEKINKFLIKKITYEPLVLGITRASLEVDSFLSASSFQQTTRILSEAAIYKKKDFLKGLKENVILGNLIPAGTGYLVNQDDIYSKI